MSIATRVLFAEQLTCILDDNLPSQFQCWRRYFTCQPSLRSPFCSFLKVLIQYRIRPSRTRPPSILGNLICVNAHVVAHRLWQASPALEFLVLGRLWFSQLLRRYKWLALLLGYDAIKSVILSNLRFASSLEYSRFWAIAHAPLWVLQCAAVAELFKMVIEAYPRIGQTSKTLFLAAGSIALTTSSIIAALTENPRFPFWLTAALAIEKAVDIGCMLLIFFQAAFFLLIRVPMRANLVRHRLILTLWWLASGFALVLLIPHFTALGDVRNLIFFAATDACCLAWAASLRADGEREPDRGMPFSKEEVENALHAYRVSQAVQRDLRDLGSD